MSNQTAFLDTVSFSEGTWGKGDNGYNVLFGGRLFSGYQSHPNALVCVGGLYSTAAGRYQLLNRYFKPYAKLLDLKDFSPASQDAIALQQIKERGALPTIDNGMFEPAVILCANIWASFPGNSYGQRTHSMESLKQFYISRGGIYNGAWKEQKNGSQKPFSQGV